MTIDTSEATIWWRNPFLAMGIFFVAIILFFVHTKMSFYEELKQDMKMLPEMQWYDLGHDLEGMVEVDLAKLKEVAAP